MVTLPLFSQEEEAAAAEERDAGEEKLASIEERLLARDGPPRPRNFWDPLKELIFVLISARTRTEVSLAVLAELELRYAAALGNWTRLRDAPEQAVLTLLAPVTFSEKKAPALQAALRRITRQTGGALSLDFFAGQPVERIRRWLESFEGVGARGSAAVVNHSALRLRALAVDGHHHRIAQRLGFVGRSATAAETEQKLLSLLPEARWPPARLTAMHDLLKLHGQIRCTSNDWQRHCAACPLLPLCPTGTATVDNVETPE
ncbi:endonuclease III [Acidipila sp. EB88]|uniref:endonuclease III domain-containing protein n=1 Tax=Acidipila sp. EB88 TaxID=2305226 RepID=UPI000F5E9CD6|nr:iron-sulfur cluster loop [Acidipila sp. EB88]RRA48021.1 iron-sulfur cluster loop [Acidipila sp. EB88]